MPAAARFAPFVCTAAQSREQLNTFVAGESACPGHAWWPCFVEAALACRPVVVVNVGANKGYSLASFVDLFAPEAGVTPAAISSRVAARVPQDWRNFPCGACQDCRAGHLESALPRQCKLAGGVVVPAWHFPVEVHGVDPIVENVAICKEGVAAMVAESGAPNVTVRVHHFAVVGDPGVKVVPFGGCPPGAETCGVEKQGNAGETMSDFPDRTFPVIEVPAVTIDTLAERAGIPTASIDILAIDTEGMDPEVLDGALVTLTAGGIKVLEFEYSGMRAWSERSLEGVVLQLERLGYDCFLAQKRTLVRLTGCWRPEYETKAWSNVICVLRAHEGLKAVAHAYAVGLAGAEG